MVEDRNVYIGHRYVPKIMGEWNQTTSYEGLSIVTHEGNSWTSKKRVPVGVAISNEEYWASTGNYNAQIEEYRKTVNEFEANIASVTSETEKNTNSIDWVSVENFPRLVTEVEDSARINRAIASLGKSNTGVGVVFLGAIEYVITNPITFDTRGITLQGYGQKTIIQAKEGYTGALLKSLTSQRVTNKYLRNVKIKSILFRGYNKTNIGIQASGFHYGTIISDCRFMNCLTGIDISNSWGLTIERNTFDYSTNGIRLGSPENDTALTEFHGVNALRMISNTFNELAGYALAIGESVGNFYETNTFESCGTAILLQKGRLNVITGTNYFEANGAYIVVGSNADVNQQPKDTIISHNTFYDLDPTKSFIHLKSLKNLTVEKNSFHTDNGLENTLPVHIETAAADNITGLKSDVEYSKIKQSLQTIRGETNIFNNQTALNEVSLFENGSGSICYWKDSSGVVHVEGASLNLATTNILFKLPTEFRPQKNKVTMAINFTGDISSIFISGTTGEIKLMNGEGKPLTNSGFNLSYRSSTRYNV